jgi:hypothetical protein
MVKTSKIIGMIAAALLAGAMIATPAGAQAVHQSGGGSGAPNGGSGGGGGGGSAHIGGGGGGGAPAVRGGGGSARFNAPAIQSPRGNVGRAPSGRFASNGRPWHGNRHHRRSYPSFGFFGWGGPYAYDYGWDEPYYYGPDCYWRHVRLHHHWVWRRYCY